MDAATWTCTNEECDSAGGGFPPEECPTCTWSTRLSGAAGFMAAMSLHQVLVQRAKDVAVILDHGSAHITFDDLREDGSFEVEWTTRCGRGCCGPEEHSATIPNRYLWTDDATIRAEMAATKEAAKKARAEEERLQKLRQAEERVRLARTAVANLPEAEAALATLRGGAP